MGVHQEDLGRIRGCINFVLVHQEAHQDGCALWECIKSVHQLCVGASRGMCSRGLRQESFLILCDALRACTAKRGRLLKISLPILNCIFQHRFERVAPAS